MASRAFVTFSLPYCGTTASLPLAGAYLALKWGRERVLRRQDAVCREDAMSEASATFFSFLKGKILFPKKKEDMDEKL
jgi:hypothetical protein